MQHKTKKIWLIALLSLLIAALFAASFTYARYYKETGVTGGKYDDTIEFVGANKYIVYTPEELVAAIENGYSYIEIAEGVEDPFVITDGVTDVSANLVLDINGHNLVRNSRNPLIDVQENVSVVIVYDSKASGSFYNPVGSLLQASGGTLTIATGNFTSGPKEEDYVTDDRTTGEGVSYSLGNYTVYYRDGYTPGATSPNRSAEYIDTGVEANLPKIVPVAIDSEAEDRYGNIYFENGIGDNAYIKEDTFLIYTEETVETPEGATVNVDFEPLCDVASCDFYYYYEKSTEGSGEDKTTTYAVIYGYHDVMAGAEQQITAEAEDAIIDPATAVIWPYATVRMTQGEAFIRGGTYTNRFGTAQSYGIYARGGSLSVQGENTSFTSVADGVCIRCTTEGGSAPALHIENGSFTSYNGDTVQVNGGTMTLASGTFIKSDDSADGTTKTAIIHMTGGALTAAGSADTSGKKSIQMTCAASAGTLSNVFGVYSEGGTVELQNAQINVNGTYSAGVLAEQAGSNVELQSVSINLSGAQSKGEITSAAVNTLGGSITLSGSNQITSDGFGITAAADVSITGGETAVGSEEATLPTTAIYVFGGSLSVSTGATLSVHAEIDENLKWAGYEESTNAYQYDGVQVNGGSLESNGTLNVTFTGLSNDAFESGDTYLTQQIKSYAVRVLNAEDVTICVGKIINSIGGGVYVGGGTVTLGTSGDTTGYSEQNKTGLTVETTGKGYSTNGTGEFSGNWNYHWNLTGGDAIKVVNGTLHVNGGKYTSQQGNGILVSSGTANIYDGYFSGKDQYRYGSGFMTGPGTSYAFKLYGGTLNIFDGEFRSEGGGAFVMGTSADNKGTANIYGGIIEAKGATAVATWQYAEVLFNNVGTIAGAPDNYPDTRDLYVSGASTGITLEGNTDAEFSVTVQGSGTFTGGIYSNENAGINITENNMTEGSNRDGIWYGNSTAKLEISGGTFQGDNRSGLYFGKVPGTTDNSQNVQISGGTFTGDSAINADSDLRSDIYTNNIFEDSAYCYTDVLQDSNSQNERRSRAICDRKLNWFSYDYYQVGGRGSNSDIHLNDTTWVNSGSEARFYERDKIVVYSGLGQVTY